MPVIRYRTRDRTALLPPTNGPMRRHETHSRPHRRHADHPGRQCFSLADRRADLRRRASSPHYLIEVTRPQRLDEIRIRVEIREDFAASEEGPEACRRSTDGAADQGADRHLGLGDGRASVNDRAFCRARRSACRPPAQRAEPRIAMHLASDAESSGPQAFRETPCFGWRCARPDDVADYGRTAAAIFRFLAAFEGDLLTALPAKPRRSPPNRRGRNYPFRAARNSRETFLWPACRPRSTTG